jgi:four helix bundle protein
MVRSAMSIAANIVEGSARKSDPEFARFVKIALASTSELEYHLIVGRDSNVLAKSDFHSLSAQTIEVRRMLYGLLRRLENPAPPNEKSTSSKLPAVS